jgi:hypothetical protein
MDLHATYAALLHLLLHLKTPDSRILTHLLPHNILCVIGSILVLLLLLLLPCCGSSVQRHHRCHTHQAADSVPVHVSQCCVRPSRIVHQLLRCLLILGLRCRDARSTSPQTSVTYESWALLPACLQCGCAPSHHARHRGPLRLPAPQAAAPRCKVTRQCQSGQQLSQPVARICEYNCSSFNREKET